MLFRDERRPVRVPAGPASGAARRARWNVKNTLALCLAGCLLIAAHGRAAASTVRAESATPARAAEPAASAAAKVAPADRGPALVPAGWPTVAPAEPSTGTEVEAERVDLDLESPPGVGTPAESAIPLAPTGTEGNF